MDSERKWTAEQMTGEKDGGAACAWREKVERALDERDLFLNPHLLVQAADEIDCCPDCEHLSHDYSVNVSECRASERGEFCPNDVAETLRALARVSRELSGSKRDRRP